MAAGAILYVGDDACRRVPVMESAGIFVLRAECSVGGVRRSLIRGQEVSAVTFHNDRFAPGRKVIATTRKLSRAPLILFKNPLVECDERMFDIIMPVPPPQLWPTSIEATLEQSRKVREFSLQLREESAAVRHWSQSLREASRRLQICPVDQDVIFRPMDGEGMEKPEDEGS